MIGRLELLFVECSTSAKIIFQRLRHKNKIFERQLVEVV